MARSTARLLLAILAAATLAGCTTAVTGQPFPDQPSDGVTDSTGAHAPMTGTPDTSVTDDSDAPATSTSSSATGEPTRSHVVVLLGARTRDGQDPTQAQLARSAKIIAGRAERIPGATVDVVPPRELRLTAPGTDPTVFDEMIQRGLVTMRPVSATWPVVNAGPSTTDTATPSSSVTTATTPTVSVPADAPPTRYFPDGSDSKVPIQPASTHASAWKSWISDANQAFETGTRPSCSDIAYYRGLGDPARPLLACDRSGSRRYVLRASLFSGASILDARASHNQTGAGWVVNVTLDSADLKTWSRYTADHVGDQTAFTMDGAVLSAPTIDQEITTPTTMISGDFTKASAQTLADALTLGALPVAFTVAARSTVR